MTAGVHHSGVAGGETRAMRAMAIVVLFVKIERVHIDAKRQRRAGAAGVRGGDDAGESAFKKPLANVPALPVRGRAGMPVPGWRRRAAPFGCRHR